MWERICEGYCVGRSRHFDRLSGLRVRDDSTKGNVYAISAALDPLPSVEDDCKEDGQG